MTLDEFIEDIFDREGRVYADQLTRPPIDKPTACGGITASALAADRGIPISAVTPAMLKALTVPEAAGVIRRLTERQLNDLHFDQIAFEPLRIQLLDYAHNSGAQLAVRWLQRTIGMAETFVDGQIGPRTLGALAQYPPVLINNALAASRARMVQTSRKINKAYKNGVINRAIGFVISTVGDVDGEADG